MLFVPLLRAQRRFHCVFEIRIHHALKSFAKLIRYANETRMNLLIFLGQIWPFRGEHIGHDESISNKIVKQPEFMG